MDSAGDRNANVAELAQRFFAICHPKASRLVEDMDAKTVSDYYAMSDEAITFCEGRLVGGGSPRSARGDDGDGCGLPANTPPTRIERASSEPSASAALREPGGESGHQPPSPFEPREPEPYDPAEPTGVDDDGTEIPF